MSNLERLDKVFSLFIRLRDAGYGGVTECISCGRSKPFREMQNGHFFSRHHISTRWDEDNCNSECVTCNCNDVHHLEGYKERLIRKIGIERFMALEERHNKIVKVPTDEEYKEMIRLYTKGCRILAKAKGIDITI